MMCEEEEVSGEWLCLTSTWIWFIFSTPLPRRPERWISDSLGQHCSALSIPYLLYYTILTRRVKREAGLCFVVEPSSAGN